MILTDGLSCALHWVSWSHLEPAVSGMEQPWPLFTDATLHPPTANNLDMDTPYSTRHLAQL